MKAFRIAVISSIPPKTGDALWLRPDEQGTFGLYYPRPGGWHPLYLETNITEEDFDRIQAALEEAVMNNYPSKEEVESTYVPNTGGLFTGSVVFNEDVIVKDDVRIVGELAVQGRIILTGTSRIKGITTPVDNDEATNKEYVDNAVNGIEDTMHEYVSEQTYTKAEVDQKIQTETATFRGTYDTWDDVPTNVYDFPDDAVDNNDYIVVRDSTGYGPLYVGTWRFKYSGSGAYSKTNWLPEYQINEEPLTPSQEAAINSGITSTKVGKLDALPTNSELQTSLAGKENISNKVSTITGNESSTTKYTSAKAVADALNNKFAKPDYRQDEVYARLENGNTFSHPASFFVSVNDTQGYHPTVFSIVIDPQNGGQNSKIYRLIGGLSVSFKIVEHQILDEETWETDGYYIYAYGPDYSFQFINLDGSFVTLLESEDFPSGRFVDVAALQVKTYQDTLVSGTNIKTINGQNVLGQGNTVVGALQIPNPGDWDDDNSGMPFSQFFGHTVQDLLKAGGAVDNDGIYYVVDGVFVADDDWLVYLYQLNDIDNKIALYGWHVTAYSDDVSEPCINHIIGLQDASVKVTSQSFTDAEKAQARANIGAIDSASKDYAQNNPTNGEYIKNRPGGFDLPISGSYYDATGSFSDPGDGYFIISDSDLPQTDRSTLLTLLYTGHEIPVTVNYVDDPMGSVMKYVPDNDIIIIPNPAPDTLSSFTDLRLNYYDIPGCYEYNMNYYVAVQFLSKYIPKELPSGGTTGQVLAKASGTNYDVEWANGGGSSDVFVAEYGVTTLQEISDAVSNGKAVLCNKNGATFSLVSLTSSYCRFNALNNSTSYYFVVNSPQTWSQLTSKGLEETANKVSTLSGNETSTTKYPNTKAVADYVSEIVGDIETLLAAI